MRRYGLVVLVLCVACSSDDGLNSTDIDISGPWLMVETIADTALDIVCRDSIPIEITQSGRHFSAEGVLHAACVGPGGSESVDVPVALTDGEIDGTDVRFEMDGCPYTGRVFGEDRADSLKGTMTCRFKDEGTQFDLQGNWLVLEQDLLPPTVTGGLSGGGAGASASFEAGDDTLYVRIHAEDNRALRTMGYHLAIDKPFTDPLRDSILVSGTVADDTLLFPLPLQLVYPLDSALVTITLFARDSSGNDADEVHLPAVWVLPARQPSVTGTIGGAVNDTVGALRDTIEIAVTASGPRALTTFGYRLTTVSDVADSVTTTETSGTHVFRIPVPFEWKGVLLEFEVFVRDALGLENWGTIGSVRVVVFPSRPTQVFPGRQAMYDIALDPVRNRLYFPSADPAGQPEFSVFDLSTPGYVTHIPLPWYSNGIDLTLSRDSALIPTYSGRLGIIDLNTFAVDSTAPLAFTPANGRWPRWVRVTDNGKAFINIQGDGGSPAVPGQLLEYELATDNQTLRADVGTGGDIGPSSIITRSGDRRRLVLLSRETDGSTWGQVYQVGSDQFDAIVPVTANGYDLAGDEAGALWLDGNHLLAGDLTPLRVLGEDTPPPGGSVLSNDGTLAYVAVPEGVAKFRTSDGVELERILLPDPPNKMLLTPDGETMIAIAPQGLLLIDLR